jgi:hypothetical protein
MFYNNSFAKECGSLDWVKEDSRTQGGGWIWFPGKATSNSKAKATLMAEGAALDYLAGECEAMHKAVKFHEKCVDSRRGSYTVHVRASITQDQCRQAKSKKDIFISKQLTRKLAMYREINARHQIDTKTCKGPNSDLCFVMANDEWKKGNRGLAMAYAKKGCVFGHTMSCGFVGYLNYEIGNHNDAIFYAEKSCSKGYEEDCELIKFAKKELN